MMRSKAHNTVGILLSILLASGTASAGLGVSGAIFEANVTPDQHISHEMIVKTDATDQPMDIVVEVIGFGRSLDGANAKIEPDLDNSPYTARPFLNVSPTSFHLEPGGSEKVMLQGIIPTNVGEGGRYALINIRSLPIGKGNVGMAVAIDVPVRLTIANTRLIKKGEITNLSIDKPILQKAQNVSLLFNNTGNYHYNAFAEAALMDKNGKVLANASTPLTTSSIIPMTARLFRMELTPRQKLWPGSYKINSTVRLEDGTMLAAKEISFKV